MSRDALVVVAWGVLLASGGLRARTASQHPPPVPRAQGDLALSASAPQFEKPWIKETLISLKSLKVDSVICCIPRAGIRHALFVILCLFIFLNFF